MQWHCFSSPTILQLSLIQRDLSSGVGPLDLSLDCVTYKISHFISLVVHARRLSLNSNEDYPISVHWGPNSFLATLGMPQWVWPWINQYGIFFVLTSHTTFKHAPKNSPHWKYCMQNNKLPTKSHIGWADNSIIILFSTLWLLDITVLPSAPTFLERVDRRTWLPLEVEI